MKNRLLASLAATLVAATSAFALPTVSFDIVIGESSYGTLGGGAFYANTESEGVFKTFCIEANQSIGIGPSDIYVYEWSNATTYAGNPLSRATAFLYKSYMTGALPGYTATDGNATALQEALWFLENQNHGVNNAFAQWAVANVGGDAFANADGEFSVRVMNVYRVGPQGELLDRQDQIVYAPVPDSGSTLVLLGLGLTLVGAISRRKLL
ncbi:MAG: VPDSG-CTERM sorting domain-containing protein [Opitutaceae bacterium]|nr:VPDSG-CTERM sorting domain-containing protein [Opitutaceae bacterium]